MKRILIEEDGVFLKCALYEGDVLTRFYRLPKAPKTGSIVLGKVKFVKKGIGVFVDIGLEREGLLSFRPGLKSGDGVLVRIETEPKEDRGCSLSEKLTLAGKFAVLTDDGKTAFSGSLTEKRREELAMIPRPQGTNFIFRSLAQEAENAAVEKEMKCLFDRYEEIKKTAKVSVPVKRLYEESGLSVAERTADVALKGFDAETKRAEAELKRRKVEKEGVELVFDDAEAMTVVDVNFHRFEERGENALYEANAMAVREFCRQVRLRNLSGIIALDYVSLKSKEEKEKLFSLLKEELKKDFVRCEAEHAERAGVFIVTRTDRYSS